MSKCQGSLNASVGGYYTVYRQKTAGYFGDLTVLQ